MNVTKSMLFLLLAICWQVTSAQEEAVSITGKLVKKTAALKDLKKMEFKESDRIFDADGKRIWPKDFVKPNDKALKIFDPVPDSYIDPVVQKNLVTSEKAATLPNAGVLLGIEGLATGSQPMDPSICVGKNHVIELVNGYYSTSMKIWNKDGTVASKRIELVQLSGHKGYGDPIALYDQWNDRYILTEFIIKDYNNSDQNGMSILVSATNDPTGQWNAYKWTIPEPIFLDFPKWSVDANGIYLHTNNFAGFGNGQWLGCFFAVFNKEEMYRGDSSFRSLRIRQRIGNGYPTCPAQVQGLSSPSGGQLFVSNNARNKATLISCNVNWATNKFNQTNAGEIPLAPFANQICNSGWACVPQPNGGPRVDAGSGVVMNQPIQRVFSNYNGLVFCFVVNAGNNRAGVRWVELRKSGNENWYKYQEATWHPNDDNQFMASIAYDGDGGIGLAYNVGSTNTYIGMKYTGRKACDPIGQMTIPETTLKSGNATSAGNRWGDYNHLVADPDGNSLWMVANYGRSGVSGNRGTYVSRFRLPQCNGANPSAASEIDNSTELSIGSPAVD